MSNTSDWNDPEVVACDGPTLNELREASVDRMLEPFRVRLSEITDDVVARLDQAVVIVRKVAAIEDPAFGDSGCGFCGVSRGHPRFTDPRTHDASDCEWRLALEWVERNP